MEEVSTIHIYCILGPLLEEGLYLCINNKNYISLAELHVAHKLYTYEHQ